MVASSGSASSSLEALYDVRQCKSFGEAEKLLNTFTPDLVLLSASGLCSPAVMNDFKVSLGDTTDRWGAVIAEAIRKLRKSDRFLPIIVIVDGAAASLPQAIE